MTKASSEKSDSLRLQVPLSRAWPWLFVLLSGCGTFESWQMPWKKEDPKAEGPKDSLILNGQGLHKAKTLDLEGQQELDAARRLFLEKDYARAEPIFHKLQKEKKTPDPIAEEAIFHEAECQMQLKNYRDAEGTYKLLLTRFRTSQYADKCNLALWKIADYWLEPTRAQMKEYQEKLDGKRTFITPTMYIHTSKDLPLLDTEGHAMLILDTIRLNDINGPLGEKALFYMATVKFYRADYREADFYFAQLYQQYPNSEFAPKAIKQSIICKQFMTGGTVYDTRSLEESKKLLHTAQTAYPELRNEEQWQAQQLAGINVQQADRDWNIAEFYRRTGHPGAAYFYYELVKRNYPGAPFVKEPSKTYAQMAETKMAELKIRMDREKAERENPGLWTRMTTWPLGSSQPAPTPAAATPSATTRPQPATPAQPQAIPEGPPPRTLPPNLASPNTPRP